MKQKRIKLIRMFQLIAITALILLAIVSMFLHISSHSKEFKQRTKAMRADYVAQQKELIKREVERVVALIAEKQSHRGRETRARVKQRVYEASAIAENIYQRNKGKKTNSEIQQMIIETLRVIRFENGSGYYFITTLAGKQILFADKPELEGKSLLNGQDVGSRFVVQDMVEIARQSEEGFYEYYWSKPGTTGRNHKKISYIKLVKPFDWFVGAGLYVEDEDFQVKEELLATISKIRFGANGYIFINRLNGDALLANGKLLSGRQKLWEVFADNPDKTKALFAQEYDAALISKGAYIHYSMNKLTASKKQFPKTSFIYGIQELQWLVGAGVYLDSVEISIAKLQAGLERQNREEIKGTILATGGIVLFILVLFQWVSTRLKKDLTLFVSMVDQAAHEDKEIECKKIYFDELFQIAGNVNTLLRDKNDVLEEMRLSEEKYQKFFDNAMVGFFRSRLSDGLLLDVNENVANVLGFKVNEIVGQLKASDLFVDLSQRQLLLEKLKKEGHVTNFEEELLLPNGQRLFCSLSVQAYPEKNYMEGILIDISEHKKAESLLKESEERFRDMAELLPEPIFESNLEMVLTYANVRATELFGFTEKDFVKGVKASDIFAPEELQKVMENTAAQFTGVKKERTEYRCFRKDGTSFQALFHVNAIVKDGKPCGLRGVVIDLTERQKAEEEILKLRKLESVGVLAGGIAHDFNNLLAGLFGNIEMAKRFLPVNHKSYKYLNSAGMSMERATGLTQQLLTFAKGGDPIKETLYLEEVITETAKFSLRGSNVKLHLNIDPELWLVIADKGQLSQVISNLVINAKQAMPNGGSVTIDAKNIATAAVKQIRLRVQDQGVGISPEHLGKIFDPYFSTKPHGSGLGLASCHSIITKHNGTIVAQSKLNQGTTFTITLPAAEIQEETLIFPPDITINVGHITARILLLDDEDLVRKMSGAMLEEMGHQIDYAVDGEEAIKKFQIAYETGQEYDIVICDLTIPGGIGGQEAAREILKCNPRANLIVSSGYATDLVMANYAEYGFKGRVAKPYLFEELQQEIQKVLNV